MAWLPGKEVNYFAKEALSFMIPSSLQKRFLIRAPSGHLEVDPNPLPQTAPSSQPGEGGMGFTPGRR